MYRGRMRLRLMFSVGFMVTVNLGLELVFSVLLVLGLWRG